MIRPFGGKHPQIHPTAFVERSAQIIGDVVLGEQSSVWFNAVVRGDVFYIRIGARTNVQDGTVIHVSNGTLIVMAGTMQQFWKHEIPKTKANVGERINLTFRKITP